jgi:hypothetical protein
MNTRFLGAGTVVGALFLFVWGGVVHSFTPPDVQGLHEFQNKTAVIEAVKAHTRGNGIYMMGEGVWAAVSLLPDGSDKTANLGPYLLREVCTDLASAFFLCLLVLCLNCPSHLSRAGALAVAALAAGMENQISDWNWYGFSMRFSLFELADIVGAWFVAGLILSVLRNKLAPDA